MCKRYKLIFLTQVIPSILCAHQSLNWEKNELVVSTNVVKDSFCDLCFVFLLLVNCSCVVLCLTHQTAEPRVSSTPCRTTSGDAGQLSTATQRRNLPTASRRTGNAACLKKIHQKFDDFYHCILLVIYHEGTFIYTYTAHVCCM